MAGARTPYPWLTGRDNCRIPGSRGLTAALMLVALGCFWNPQSAAAFTHKPPINATQETPKNEGLVTTTEAAWQPVHRQVWLPDLGENVTEAYRNVSGTIMFCLIITSRESVPMTTAAMAAFNSTLSDTLGDATQSTPTGVATPGDVDGNNDEAIGDAPLIVNGTGTASNVTYALWNCTLPEPSTTTTAKATKRTSTVSSSTLPTIVPNTTPAPLNTSDVFMEYWVKTVISEDRNINVSAPSWIMDMETRLAKIYEKAFKKLEAGRRRRRAATVGDTTLQMVHASRDSVGGTNVTMLYYMERYGNVTPALSAVAAINILGVQEIALILGKVVIVKAEVFAPLVNPPPEDRKLWLIGAVIGGIIGFILLVWCVLFIYCKCTRPAKAHQRTPRTPRSTRISMTGEYTDTNSYRNKMPKIQGFDIARTEVGLENEIQKDLKRKPGGTDSYRRHPDGSTELEGMYSTGETPPPKPIGYTNTPPGRVQESGEGEEGQTQTLNRNKSRSHIPIDSSLRRSLPPRPDTSQETIYPPKKKSKKKHAESEESDSEDDRSEDRKPLSPDKQEKSKKSKKKTHKVRNEDKARVKGKHKKKKNQSDDEDEDHELDSSQAALYENVAKMTRGIGEVKLRSTQHAIRLPPLITQPLVGDSLTMSLREETELQESLQQKADIERWRNKQRHRERTKGSKGSHQDDSKEARRVYRRAQREIGNILGEANGQVPQVFQKKPKKKKKKKHSEDSQHYGEMEGVLASNVQHAKLNGIDNERNLVAHQQSTRDAQSDSGATSVSTTTTSSSSEGGSHFRARGGSPEPTLEEARIRMHALVDNAFALISPYHSNASIVWQPDEDDAAPRHTPMYIAPVTKVTSQTGQVVWSPYTAADEAAKIPSNESQGVILATPMQRSGDQPMKPVRPVRAYNYTNPAYVKDTDPEPTKRGSRSILETSLDHSGLSESTRVEPLDVSALQRSPREVRHAMASGDDYTSIVMDSRLLNPGQFRTHNPPERETEAIASGLYDQDDTLLKSSGLSSQSSTGTVIVNGVATVYPLSETSSSMGNQDQTFSESQNSLLKMLPEQLSLQMPSTDLKTEFSPNEGRKIGVLKDQKTLLEPEMPKLSEDPDEDEIDVVQRRINKQGKAMPSNWPKSLRSELERLANRSSADTVISTTALV